MARQIFVVDAKQVVTSQDHPEGTFTNVSGFPKTYDSRDYERTTENPDGNEELTLIVAKAEYADRVKQLSLAHNRAMWTVTLTRADGRQIERATWGSFPVVTPEPEPEPEVEG